MKFNRLLVVAGFLFLTACSSNISESFKVKNEAIATFITENELVDVKKVNSFKFHGWNSLTDDYLLLSSSPKRKYLVSLSGHCSDIRWAHAIVLNRSIGSSLQSRFDSVSTPNAPQLKCFIGKIYPVTKDQVSNLMLIKNPPEVDENKALKEEIEK